MLKIFLLHLRTRDALAIHVTAPAIAGIHKAIRTDGSIPSDDGPD